MKQRTTRAVEVSVEQLMEISAEMDKHSKIYGYKMSVHTSA